MTLNRKIEELSEEKAKMEPEFSSRIAHLEKLLEEEKKKLDDKTKVFFP